MPIYRLAGGLGELPPSWTPKALARQGKRGRTEAGEASTVRILPGESAKPRVALGLREDPPPGTSLGPEESQSEARVLVAGSRVAALDGWIFQSPWGSSPKDVLRAWIQCEDPADFLKKLEGDFALLRIDAEAKTLWAARDAFGARPLYLTRTPGALFASSRIAGLRETPGVPLQPRESWLARFAAGHYRSFDLFPDQSPFERVHRVPPGSVATWSLEDPVPSFQSFFEPELDPRELPPRAEREELFRQAFRAAVEDRLKVARSPIFTLSGGMDSSSVLAMATKIRGEKLPAVSTVYEDPTYDERDEIRTLIEDCVSEWIPVEVGDPDLFACLEEMVRIHDEPVATATWLSHFLMTRDLGARGYDAVFGGLGGDELHAGEFEHFFFFFADLLSQGDEGRFDSEVAGWVEHHDHPIFRKNEALARAKVKERTDPEHPGRCLPDWKLQLRYQAALRPGLREKLGQLPDLPSLSRSYLHSRTYQDLAFETVVPCARAEERQGAAEGLSNFLPFLDRRVFEVMFQVPPSWKYQGGVTKAFLRSAMQGILPDATRLRIPKTGWNAPAHRWFLGSSGEELEARIRDSSFSAAAVYNREELLRLLREHREIVASGRPQENHMMLFWQVANLEVFLRHVGGSA